MQSRVFVSLLENENYAFEGRRFPQSQTIPAIDFIYEEDASGNGKEVAIRYIPGEKSIYLEEQVTDKKIMPAPIVMDSSGHITVSNKEINKLNYLLKCNYNASNENRMPEKTPVYREFSAEKEAEKQLEVYREDKQLRDTILMLEPDELEALATILGEEKASERPFKILLRDVLIAADNNPEFVKGAMLNTENKRKALLMKAFAKKLITYDSKTNEICWGSGGKIARVPMGKDHLDYFTELTFMVEYSSVIEELNMQLNPEKVREKKIEEKATDDQLKQIYDQAISAGIITAKEFWYSLSDVGPNHKFKNFCKGRGKSLIFFRQNEELQSMVRERLGAEIKNTKTESELVPVS